MSFFAMPYIMHSSGHFKTVHRDLSLFSITPYTRLPDGGQVCTILKCPWTGPYIRALSKKRHTHAPTKRNVIKKIPLPRLRILRRCFKNNAKAKDISKNEGP